MPPPTQIRQMPPPQQTQPSASPVAVVPATGNSTVVTSVPPPVTLATSVHALPDAAPGTIEADPQHDGKSKFFRFLNMYICPFNYNRFSKGFFEAPKV